MGSGGPSRSRVLAFVEIGMLAAISVAAYVWTYQAQRRLFLAGVNVDDPYTFPRVGFDPGLIAQAVTTQAIGAAWAGTVTSCAVIAVVALALMPVYWPRYAGMAIALLAMQPSWVTSAQQVALAAGAMVTAPLGDLAALGAISFDDMFRLGLWWGLTVPVAACAVSASSA